MYISFYWFYSVVNRDCKDHNFASSPYLLIIIRSGCLAEIKWPVCMLKSYWSLYVSFSRSDVGLCLNHLFVCSNLNSCTIPIGSPCRRSQVYFFILSELTCCIRLLCDWSFRLYHHIAYICCFVASYALISPSSSSSCRTIGTCILDPVLPPVSTVHRFR